MLARELSSRSRSGEAEAVLVLSMEDISKCTWKVWILFAATHLCFLSTFTYAVAASPAPPDDGLGSTQNGCGSGRFPSGTNFLMLQSPSLWLGSLRNST